MKIPCCFLSKRQGIFCVNTEKGRTPKGTP